MQERLLARRVLEFGTRQTRFVCDGDLTWRCDGWSRHPEFGAGRHNRLLPEMIVPDATVVGSSTLHSLLDDWRLLVFHYTRRQLSVSSDRVLAISGLAERYSRRIHSQYLAGFWRAGLPIDLLWRTRERQGSKRVKRPSCYQGPSWSWVSVNEPIDHRLLERTTARSVPMT